VVKVDVLSYLDPAVTDVRFGPVPAIPGGIYTGEQEIVSDVEVNLVAGTGSVAEVQDVSLTMSVIAEDSTGSGADTLRLYLGDQNTDPRETEAAADDPDRSPAGRHRHGHGRSQRRLPGDAALQPEAHARHSHHGGARRRRRRSAQRAGARARASHAVMIAGRKSLLAR
jgi:hypothetical protein